MLGANHDHWPSTKLHGVGVEEYAWDPGRCGKNKTIAADLVTVTNQSMGDTTVASRAKLEVGGHYSWDITVVKSKSNDGDCIDIGVVPYKEKDDPFKYDGDMATGTLGFQTIQCT